jgi:hypothetical protein
MGGERFPRTRANNIQEFEYEDELTVHHEQVSNRLLKQPDERPNRISRAPDSRICSCAE